FRAFEIVSFQAEDGIRYRNVTGVQTCALPILNLSRDILKTEVEIADRVRSLGQEVTQHYKGQEISLLGVLKGSFIFMADLARQEIGRASCRERVWSGRGVVGVRDSIAGAG